MCTDVLLIGDIGADEKSNLVHKFLLGSGINYMIDGKHLHVLGYGNQPIE